MGSIASFGVLAYALGKLFLTGLGDFWGGRINFLIGLGGRDRVHADVRIRT